MRNSHKAVHVLAFAAALFGCSAASSQSSNPLAVAQLASSCANCHGTQGRAADGSALPSLAGMPKAQTMESLRAFKAGTKPATIMHQLSKGYTDAQLEQIADYFAGQKK
ncbi:c-type cytochrome [Ramlibacter albus]|uniref:C-type cytochrome n=1 Tax=Ramlibacter albus TaxID=2079448 RepID=A0A923MAP5_9BURK|nr:c-type cytochrome [Ramlibacter albus]MBC5766510.1 c-type cytochrome [Ramlibacter albus]